MHTILLHSAGPGGLVFILVLIVAAVLIVRKKPAASEKDKPAGTNVPVDKPTITAAPVDKPAAPPATKRKRKTLAEAKAEGIKEGIEFERQSRTKEK